AEIRQLRFQRIVEPYGDDLVALHEVAQELGPARLADEIGDDEDQRAALDHVRAGLQQFPQVRASALRRRLQGGHLVQDLQYVAAAVARRDHRLDTAAVEERADAVAMAREQPRQHRDELL